MALTSKERKALRSMANTLEATLIVGKDNVNDGVAAQAAELLDTHELVKGSVLETSELTAREAANQLTERCGAECVQVIGRKFVLYRASDRDDVAHIQFGPDGSARLVAAPKPAKKRPSKKSKAKKVVKPRSAIKAREERKAALAAANKPKHTFHPLRAGGMVSKATKAARAAGETSAAPASTGGYYRRPGRPTTGGASAGGSARTSGPSRGPRSGR